MKLSFSIQIVQVPYSLLKQRDQHVLSVSLRPNFCTVVERNALGTNVGLSPIFWTGRVG